MKFPKRIRVMTVKEFVNDHQGNVLLASARKPMAGSVSACKNKHILYVSRFKQVFLKIYFVKQINQHSLFTKQIKSFSSIGNTKSKTKYW